MITQKQQNIQYRRDAVAIAYKAALNNKEAISPIVEKLAKKFKVSQVTIYGDINHLGLNKQIGHI